MSSPRKPTVLFLVFLLLTLSCVLNTQLIMASSKRIAVPDDYSTIQEAIDNANEGDTINVKRGLYHESLSINKSLSIKGESIETTTIVGDERLNGTALLIRRDGVNVTGFTIENANSFVSDISHQQAGILLLNVRGCNIFGNLLNRSHGIFLYDSYENNISGNSVINSSYGIRLEYSGNNTIALNFLINNENCGLELLDSTGNNVSGNTVHSQEFGFRISGSRNLLRNNRFDNNIYNFNVESNLDDGISEFLNDIDVSNLVNGKPVYYWIGESDKTVPFDAGYVALVNCENITVRNIDLSRNGEGILLVNTTDSRIREVRINGISRSILLYGSSGNTLEESVISENMGGVQLVSSSKNKFCKNIITKNVAYGFLLNDATNNTVSANTITGHQNGITFRMNDSSKNGFYHNNFENNSKHIDLSLSSEDGILSPNLWDNRADGNYWDDYEGVDSDEDGKGDTPYVIDKNNKDNYPLMEPVSTPAFQAFYIRADGSVEGTDKIKRNGNVYTFTDDLKGSLLVERDNVVINGNLHLLSGEGAFTGICLFDRSWVTIRNLEIRNFSYGIQIYDTTQGYSLRNVNLNVIAKNRINENRFGIWIGDSDNSPGLCRYHYISGNTISGNSFGVYFERAEINTVYGNNFVENENHASSKNAVNIWEDGFSPIGNYWDNHLGFDDDGDGIADNPYIINENNRDALPLMNSWTALPIVFAISPENNSYSTRNILLNFVVSEPTSWIGYSLDGQANITISESTLLNGLSSGSHSLVIYANDIAGNTGTSEVINFSIQAFQFEFSSILVIVAVEVVLIGSALLVLSRINKENKKAKQSQKSTE